MNDTKSSNGRVVAAIAGVLGAAIVIGGAAAAVGASGTIETTETTTSRSAAGQAQGVTGYAWNETATDIQLDVRESGYKWSKQTLQPYGGEGEFTGHDKGNAGVDVFGSATHADGKKVFFELDESLDYGNTARIGTEAQMKSNTMQEKSFNVDERWTVTIEGHAYTIDRQRDMKYTLMNIQFDS